MHPLTRPSTCSPDLLVVHPMFRQRHQTSRGGYKRWEERGMHKRWKGRRWDVSCTPTCLVSVSFYGTNARCRRPRPRFTTGPRNGGQYKEDLPTLRQRQNRPVRAIVQRATIHQRKRESLHQNMQPVAKNSYVDEGQEERSKRCPCMIRVRLGHAITFYT